MSWPIPFFWGQYLMQQCQQQTAPFNFRGKIIGKLLPKLMALHPPNDLVLSGASAELARLLLSMLTIVKSSSFTSTIELCC
jgi:hypothetical protein